MGIELTYLELVNDVLEDGFISDSRAGGTYSLPGVHVDFDLREGFPLLTTRQMYYKGVFGELAAFVRGAEDLDTFEKFGCHYWFDNAHNWEPNKGKPVSEWQVGKSYGSLWRNFHGVDQLSEVIQSIKKDPYSRRHVVTAWDPSAKACLPSCHIMFQFYVRANYLYCHVYMRSVDLCVGLPSDMALYGLLMHLVAKDTNLEPALLSFSFGDCHIYHNHIFDYVNTQEKREVLKLPKILIADHATTLTFVPEDIEVVDYEHDDPIKYILNP